MAPAIAVEGVSKRFRLYHEQYKSLKERVIHAGRNPYEDFWALRDVDLEIEEGETFGLLGHNGSGKSTLLKCIAAIIRPTSGEIRTRGRVAAMLELGTGFHPELTGRENVYLNASILGFSRRDIDAKFDAIVGFSELEPFIDQQVKHYSSGMYVRLGFAVAVHMDPEILLVDEVLAVGDEAFQAKCIARIKQFQQEGRTILIVTHAADQVQQVCDRAGVLDHGELILTGSPGEAVRTMRERLFALSPTLDAPADDLPAEAPALVPAGVSITAVRVEHPNAAERAYLIPGEPLSVTVEYDADGESAPIPDTVFWFSIYDDEGEHLFGTSTDVLDVAVPPLHGRGSVRFAIPSVPLLDGAYFIEAKITDAGGSTVFDWRTREEGFEVMNPSRTRGRVALEVTASVEAAEVPESAAG